MTDRQSVKHGIRNLQYIKTWQLLILLVLFAFIAATFLRLNNVGMIQRREAVLHADENGDPDQIKSRLFELQRYVSSHMNTSMGTIYLEHTYRHDSQQVIDIASGDSNPNGNIYKKAQEVCAPKFTSYSQAYLQCTVNYLEQYNPADDQVTSVSKLDLPKADAYRHSYASPVWSADFAGFSVLICIVIILTIVLRLLVLLLLRIILMLSNR